MTLSPVQPPTPGTLLPLAAAERLPAALQSGRPVRARVYTDATGRLLAVIGRIRLVLDGKLALRTGEELTVRLVDTAGGPALEILARRPPPSAAAIMLLRQAIPRQQDLSVLLAALRALRLQPQRWEAFSAEQRQSADEMLARLASSTQLQQAQGVRAALRDSGVLLEWLLARYPQAAAQIVQSDFKAGLLRLIARLQEAPAASQAAGSDNAPDELSGLSSGLLQQAEGALARLQLLQLQPLESPGGLDLACQIPLAHGNDTDDLYLRIRRQTDRKAAGRQANAREPTWEVSLRFRFAGTEALSARLSVIGRRAAVTWWTDDSRLAAAVEAAAPVLAERLRALDLEVGLVRCHRAQAPPERTDATRPQGGLIHETA
ncbi:MAG TPA: flagellar hook-length control protein FliK [Nitrococcus sp.]|nr:flagellar hook-length control protein FliK [Nitrococcus sp.]